MNKRELVLEIAGRTGMEPEAVVGVVDALVDTVAATVAGGERVVIQGFGTFVRQPRARRVARDINTDRRLVVPATHVPVFRAGKPFRDLVASPRKRRGGAARASRVRRPTVLRSGATAARSAIGTPAATRAKRARVSG